MLLRTGLLLDSVLRPGFRGSKTEQCTNNFYNEIAHSISSWSKLAVKANYSLLLWIDNVESDVSAT